ncbi:MAG: SIR2 family protein [Gammaproteobacteria bacterium]|nr:SIR2 family protein [Gammaproteobacteria bacterium]
MSDATFSTLLAGLKTGDIVPYLGPGILAGATNDKGEAIPADSDSLIYAMNNGQAMAPRLMYEFPRAAMHMELKRGRSFVNKFLSTLYGETAWSRAPLHDWLASFKPAYVVDINRDTQLQDSYAETPHILITGISRIGGTDYRFKIYQFDGNDYREVSQEGADTSLPILFKPMGTPRPEGHFIASDADYVDYITELMGGFAIPSFVKQYRPEKQYLFLGMRFTRDSERMVMSDITYAAGTPRGWALITEPTAKELRFCKRMGIEIIEADHTELMNADAGKPAGAGEAQLVGC